MMHYASKRTDTNVIYENAATAREKGLENAKIARGDLGKIRCSSINIGSQQITEEFLQAYNREDCSFGTGKPNTLSSSSLTQKFVCSGLDNRSRCYGESIRDTADFEKQNIALRSITNLETISCSCCRRSGFHKAVNRIWSRNLQRNTNGQFQENVENIETLETNHSKHSTMTRRMFNSRHQTVVYRSVDSSSSQKQTANMMPKIFKSVHHSNAGLDTYTSFDCFGMKVELHFGTESRRKSLMLALKYFFFCVCPGDSH
jgi:hypothetical protein